MRLAFDASYMNLDYLQFNGMVTGMTEDQTSNVVIYPNPFSSTGLMVRMDEEFSYKITDITGFQLEEGKGSQAQTVGAGLKPGVYIISVEGKNGVMVKKIVKE